VTLGAGAELKEKPVPGVVGGLLRLMMLGLGREVVDGLTGVCTFTPRKEDAELAGDKEGAGGERGENGAMDDVAGEDMGDNPGLDTGEGEHTEPVAATKTGDSMRIVLVPSGPVEEKTETPSGRPVGAGAGGEVGTLPKLKLDAGDVGDVSEEVKGTELEDTIPPKLNVLAADVELD
jgi:hypothetical protein